MPMGPESLWCGVPFWQSRLPFELVGGNGAFVEPGAVFARPWPQARTIMV